VITKEIRKFRLQGEHYNDIAHKGRAKPR